MAYALQIPCVTKQYFPDTLENIKKLCAAASFQVTIPEDATCCGLPYFEKGELLQAKSIGEYNIKVYGQNEVISASPKCCNTLLLHYPDIFNNTVSHNDATHLAKQLCTLSDLLAKLPKERFKPIKGHYFYVRECCRADAFQLDTLELPGITWTFSPLSPTCCGAGASLPVSNHELSVKMAMALIDAFKASGAEAMVFEDDICRKHILNSAAAAQISIEHHHIIDILVSAL
jgi:L-lactate dehydrogenase complex protein LldE